MGDEGDVFRKNIPWPDLELHRDAEFIGKEYLSTFARMEVVMDKLKILNYEADLLPEFKRMGYRAITREFFAWSHEDDGRRRVNVFYPFIALCQWLLQKIGRNDFLNHVDIESQDPIITIKELTNIMHDLKIPVHEGEERKLVKGYGQEVVRVLHNLCDEAISHSKLGWRQSPIYPEDDPDEDGMVDDDNCEVQVDDEESIEEEDEEDEEVYMDLDTSSFSKVKEPECREERLGTVIDSKDWQEEVERVLPSLKVIVRQDNRDWRSHIEQMENYKKSVESSKPTQDSLQQLVKEISEALGKIESRENYINRTLESDIMEYSRKNAELAEIKAKYKKASSGISERTHQLMQLTEELDQLKQEMEEKGSVLTNTEPIVNIKKAKDNITNESIQMDMRIGVLQHILLHFN